MNYFTEITPFTPPALDRRRTDFLAANLTNPDEQRPQRSMEFEGRKSIPIKGILQLLETNK